MDNELSRTVDALPGLVWTALPDGHIEFVNQRWCEFTGMTVKQAAGGGWQAAIHPDDLPMALQQWRAVVDSGAACEIEARMRRSDGEYRWFLCRASPITDAGGKVVKWCGINSDIEDWKQSQAAVRAHEERFRLIVDGLPTRVILFSPEGKVLHANRYTLEYSGATVEELKQWESKDFTHPDDKPATVARFYAAITSGQPYDFESRHRRADGVYRWFRVQGFPLRDNEGRIALWYFLQTDIDDHKRAEALLAGEKRLLEMVAMGQPLFAVLESLCKLAEEIASDCLCSISLLDTEDMSFRWVGNPSLGASYTYPLKGCPVSDKTGPCGAAAFFQEQILVPDIASDSRWTHAWHEQTLAHGLRSCWATPIVSRTYETQGTVTIYRTVPGDPTPFHQELIGHVVRISSVAIGRAQSDQALKRSEESFRAIVETTPESVKVIDRDGAILRVNSVGAEIGGVASSEALLGKSFYDFVVPEHRERYIAFNRNICSGSKGHLNFDIINQQGARRHLETHAAPLRNSDGSTVQLAVTRDVTARERTNARLHQGAALMAQVEQLTQTGGFFWRPEREEYRWSDQLYAIFGIAPGTPISMDKIAERIHPGDQHLLNEMIEQANAGKDLECDHRLLLPDGTIKYVSLRAHAALCPLGVRGYIGAVQDVTQRRHAEEALSSLRADLAHLSRVNSLGALTASIAHEINQPLAGIMTNAATGLRMLSADPPRIESAIETVRRTIRDGRRASEVMTRLRALFQKKAVTTAAIDLAEACGEVIELLRGEMRKRRIVPRLRVADGLPAVAGDRVQLQQVVLNLLLNAMEAMEGVENRAREVLVMIERQEVDEGDHVQLAVADSGTGFDPQKAGQLFDAFYTTKGDGMGIGLSVSRNIIDSHGGRLWASANRDFGATFSFSIPCNTVSS